MHPPNRSKLRQGNVTCGSAAAAAVVLLLLAGRASLHAATISQTSTVDGVTVTFTADDTEQGRKDLDTVKKTFDNAVAKSDDMKAKVKDAGSKFGNKLTVFVVRNVPNVFVGLRPGRLPSALIVDVGDIEKVTPALTSEKTDKDKAEKDIKAVADNLLLDVLAHEIDHQRDGTEADPTKQKHSDPAVPKPPPAGKSYPGGPAVEDANKVHKALGTGVQRNDYITIGADGVPVQTYTVNGQKVTLNLKKHIEEMQKQEKGNRFVEYSVSSGEIGSIPDQPCPEGPSELPCYAPATRNDSDLDGVPSSADNAPGLANPQQADFDGDGVGNGGDPDDNGNGVPDALEIATGVEPSDSQRRIEHWSDPESCRNGIDDDHDGFVDVNDASCRPPVLDPFSFPRPVVAEYPDYQRRDLGGVPELQDALAVTGELLLDVNFDGRPDETSTFDGAIAIQEGLIGDIDGDGLHDVPILISAVDVRGTSRVLGAHHIFNDVQRTPSGQLEQRVAGPVHYPAASFFDIFFDIRDPQGRPHLDASGSARYAGTITHWPPYSEGWTLTSIVVLTDRLNRRVAQIVGGRLTVKSPFQ